MINRVSKLFYTVGNKVPNLVNLNKLNELKINIQKKTN